jgi:hypothetical protein
MKKPKKPKIIQQQKLPGDIDSNLYVWSRWASFLGASAISAILNVMFFQGLDPSLAGFMLFLSVVLEVAKLVCIMSYNVLHDMSKKVVEKSVKVTKVGFLIAYGAFALLSMSASLGFSTRITAETEEVSQITTRALQVQKENIENKLKDIEDQNLIERISLDEYPQYIEANALFQTAEAEYQAKNTAYRSAIADRDRETRYDNDGNQRNEWTAANQEVNATNQELSAALTARNSARDNRSSIESRFNERKTQTAKTRENLNNELISLISQAGLEGENGQLALIGLQGKIDENNLANIKAKGAAYAFEVWGRATGFGEQKVKFIILIFISILLELVIFVLSPDIKITRKSIFFFRGTLPNGYDIESLLNVYDEEYNRYTKGIVKKENIDEKKKEWAEEELYNVKQINETLNKEKADIEEKAAAQFELWNNALTEIENKKTELAELTNENNELKEKLKNAKKEKKEKKKEPVIEIVPEIEKLELKKEEISVETPFTKNEEYPEILSEEDKTQLMSDHKTSHQYRFGKSSERVKDKIIDFINSCINEPGKFIISPEDGARMSSVNEKLRDVFLDHLNKLEMNGEPLIYKEDDQWYSSADKNSIIKYATEIVNI